MAGQLVAEYIVDGQASFDGSDFDPDRFMTDSVVSTVALAY